jgi:hypothetical protein
VLLRAWTAWSSRGLPETRSRGCAATGDDRLYANIVLIVG